MNKKEFIEAVKKDPSLFEKRHEIPQTNNHGESVFFFGECSEPFTCMELEELERIYNSEVKKYMLEGLKQAYESAVERGCDTSGMSAVEYFAHVKPDLDEHDYGTWHQFKDTFPPISNWDGITVEVLYESGNPGFEWFILNKVEGTVQMRDYDSNLELLEWQLDNWMERYWRFIPNPPGNFGYIMEPIRLNKESVSLDKLKQICEQEPDRMSAFQLSIRLFAKADERPKNLHFGKLMSKEEYTKQLLEEPHLMYKGEADASSGRTLIWFPDCEDPFTLEELDNIEVEAYREIAEFVEEPLEETKNLSSFYQDNMQPVYTKPQGTSSYFRDHLHVQRMMRGTPPHKTGAPMELLDELERELEVKERHENNQDT